MKLLYFSIQIFTFSPSALLNIGHSLFDFWRKSIFKFAIIPSSFCGFRFPSSSILSKLTMADFPGIMMRGMLSFCHQLQIFNTIIKTIFVYMMDNLTASQRSSNMLLHDKSMLKHFFSINTNVSRIYSSMNPASGWPIFFSLKLSCLFNSESFEMLENTCYSKNYRNFFLCFIFRNVKASQSISKFIIVCSSDFTDFARRMSSFMGARFTANRTIPDWFSAISAAFCFASHFLFTSIWEIIAQGFINSNKNFQEVIS